MFCHSERYQRQTELMIGAPGPDRRHPGGWAPYPLLGFLVGGSPTARIDAVLREDKGYTYGIRSTFRPRRRGGVFITAGSVRSEVTGDALRLLLDVLEHGREGFTQDEVDHAAQFLVLTAPSRYATADTIADGIAVRQPVATSLATMQRAVDRVVAVPDDEILAAMRLIYETTGLFAEGTGGAALAAALRMPGSDPVVIPNCGGNLTAEQKKDWLGIA